MGIMYIHTGLYVHVGYCLNPDIFLKQNNIGKAPEPLYQGPFAGFELKSHSLIISVLRSNVKLIPDRVRSWLF